MMEVGQICTSLFVLIFPILIVAGLVSCIGRGPPSDAAAAEATRPYHGLDAYRPTRWFEAEVEQNGKVSLVGKVAVVTGGSAGIGRAVASALYKRGATVIITGRSLDRTSLVAEEMRRTSPGAGGEGIVKPAVLELGDLDDVRRFAREFLTEYGQLDFLVENAGAAMDSTLEYTSKQGYESLYAGNYLGHFMLLQLLLPALKPGARVTATSSIAHWYHSTGRLDDLLPTGSLAQSGLQHAGFWAKMRQYGNTKLLQILMVFEAQRRLRDRGITFTPVAPGFIATSIGMKKRGTNDGLIGWVGALPREYGAMTTLHALLSPSMEGKVGIFLQPYSSPLHLQPPRFGGFLDVVVPFEFLGQRLNWGCYEWLPHPAAHRRDFGHRLWEASEQACGLI
jgi:NAD(P)-dependent dehydrogenase (short-subunit alcohol dehydrogenase family)